MKTIENFKNSIDVFLSKNLSKKGVLAESIRYSTLNGGKRIRPLLCISSFHAAKGKGNAILPLACAIELLHTFSLIHDDLPCMDDDDYRRGKLTNHKVYGEDIALLSGDALLSLAYDWIINAKSVSDTAKIKILKELAECAGINGIIGGQVLDLKTPKDRLKQNTLKKLYFQKTAMLIRASVRIGAIAVNADTVKLKLLTKYGENLGMAFQVVDDILDYGKDKGINYAQLYGKEKAEEYAKKLINNCFAALKPFGENADTLKEIALNVINQIR